ncbi:Zn(2)-C6 fungal-type domain-containing protein [Fusarium sp. LHS14.1]|nr:Zn(2)-C6 fungal-type domain-containing protein [Fusarium sp. LHS14.1]
MQSANACLACRKVKTKCCLGSPGTVKCDRCARKSLDCVFRKHHRGRKPGTRVSKLRRTSAVAASSVSPDQVADNGSQVPKEHDNLQPSGLLNVEAVKGRFSLRNILSASDEPDEPLPDLPDPDEDPIHLGLVNSSIAKSLFDSFMAVLNPYICQLDPILHTFPLVRQKSAFLFSAILTMSAKAFNPIIYGKLYDHVQDLFTKSFRRGTKSTETVQAILILTYWKEPQDSRVWILMPYSPQRQASGTESTRRVLRNIERTWYVLFVYDRSISLQTGKPWMIECDDFMESVEAWSSDPMASDNDLLLGSFVTLRLVTSAAFTLLIPRPHRPKPTGNDAQPLISLLSDRIDRWETRWAQAIGTKTDTEEQSCHQFLVRFYGTHLRLQLHSLPLQGMLASGESDVTLHLDTIWLAYRSAMSMLRLISQYSTHLYFAQDSIHVMTAYSAAFLVKILLSVPSSVTEQVECDTIQAIQGAAEVFSEQSGTANCSCALQARFLTKVAAKLLQHRSGRNLSHCSSAGDPPCPVTLQDGEGELGLASELFPSDNPLYSLDPTTSEVSVLQGGLDFSFEGDQVWSEMFASMGLMTQDEVFIPSCTATT